MKGIIAIPIYDPEYLINYLKENDIDYLIILTPATSKAAPMVYDREEIDKASEEGTLETFIREKWENGNVALVF